MKKKKQLENEAFSFFLDSGKEYVEGLGIARGSEQVLRVLHILYLYQKPWYIFKFPH